MRVKYRQHRRILPPESEVTIQRKDVRRAACRLHHSTGIGDWRLELIE
jgi:hypothetical protein